MTKKIKCALIGPGNIGTDLLAKLQRSTVLEPVWMVGIDPESDGLKRAREMGIKTTSDGVDGLLPHVLADGVQIAFDATSAYVHAENSRKLNALGVLMIDLTPAAIGPFCVPPVNLMEQLGKGEMNVNMVTCGGQATIPMVAAVSRVQPVAYGEIVATVSSRSVGPGTRKNIDEFTRTTAGAVEKVGGQLSADVRTNAVAAEKKVSAYYTKSVVLGTDGADADAGAIVKWIRAGDKSEFTRREAQKAQEGRFRSVERLQKALERLGHQDVLREFKRHNKGAPPTTAYRVNPKVLST